MEQDFNAPYYSVIKKPKNLSDIDNAISWKGADIGYNWLNTDFPFRHEHNHWELFIVTQGSLSHYLNGRSYVMKKYDAWLIRPNDVHSMERINEKPLNHLSFLIRPEYFEKVCGVIYEDLYEKLLNADYPLSFQVSDPEIETIKIKLNAIKRFIPEEAEHNIRKTKIVFLSIFALFVENFEQKTSPFPPWLDTLLGKLNESKFDELTLKELANETPYSYSRMSVLFKQYLGMPLVKYVNNIKLAKAANVLVNTTKGILEIALDLGYTSLSSFNHGFKNAYGVSPSVYRKKSGKKGMFPPVPPPVSENS